MKRKFVMFLAFGLGFSGSFGGPPSGARPTAEATGAKTRTGPESLSPAGEQELRAIVASGRLPDLQWPNFSAHSRDVKEFYEEDSFKLGWSQGARPTAQALELIEILQHAEQKVSTARIMTGIDGRTA